MSSRLPPRSRISQRVSGRAREARNRLPRASSPFTPGGTTLTRSSPAAPQEIPPNVYTRLGHEAVYSSDDELSSERYEVNAVTLYVCSYSAIAIAMIPTYQDGVVRPVG